MPPGSSSHRLCALGRHVSRSAGAGAPTSGPLPSRAPHSAGVVRAPVVTDDPTTAHEYLRRDGAVLFQCVPANEAARLTEEEVIALIADVPARVLGESVVASLPPVCKRLGIGSGRDRPGDQGLERNQPHMDTAYGSQSNDYLVLMHSKFAATGGENYLLDAIEVLESLSPRVRAAASDVLFEGVAQTSKNQWDGEEIRWRGACFQTLGNGRKWLLTPTGGGIRNVDGSGGLAAYLAGPAACCNLADRQAGEDLVSALHAAISLTEPQARRFVIGPGQALLCDNYRMFHGRDLFTGSRDLWRVWFWSDEAAPEAISLAESLAGAGPI